MGLLLSMVMRGRWISLTGLAVGFTAIGIRFLTNNSTLVTIMFTIAVLLMLAGTVVSVYRNVKAVRTGEPPSF
jgi:hypothetical protein